MARTILLATDGSSHSMKAARIAGELAAGPDDRVAIIHVKLREQIDEGTRRMVEVEHLAKTRGQGPAWDNVPAEMATMLAIDRKEAASGEVLDKVAEWVLDQSERAVRDAGGSHVERISERGDPGRRIVEAAENVGADYVVMGCRGLSEVESLFMGSVSHKVANKAPCTVICVR